MSKGRGVVLFLLAAALAGSFVLCGYEKGKTDKAKSKNDLYGQLELFADSISIIRSDYVDEVDPKKLIYGAMKGMLSSLDDFSQFLEPEEYNELRLETKGEFGGVGTEIALRDGILTIIAPISGTPAEAAGIKASDRIVKIDGSTTKGITLNEAVKKMRGKPGTTVILTIWREKEEKIFDVSIRRAVISIHSIKKAEFIEDKIGYIKLIEFQENTPHDLEEALKKLEASGMDGLILDLRNNPGGLLDVAVDVAEKFLAKDKVVVSTKSRDPEQNVVFKSSGRYPHPDYPMIALVNEGSASASEIVAGALQDNKRGILLGTKTFGKASVQAVIPLKDGSAVRLTTASYFTPGDKMIRDHGIIPDIVMEKEEPAEKEKAKPEPETARIFEKLEEKARGRLPEKESAAKSEPETDNQIETAVRILKAMKICKEEKG